MPSIWTQVGIHMGSYPLIDRGELRVAQPAVTWNLVALALFRAAWVLEVDGLQVVFVSVAPQKYAQQVAAVVAAGPIFERAPELAIVGADFFPVALEMAKQVVGPSESTLAQLAHMWSAGRLQMRRLVGGQVGEVKAALRALALFAWFPLALGRFRAGGC